MPDTDTNPDAEPRPEEQPEAAAAADDGGAPAAPPAKDAPDSAAPSEGDASEEEEEVAEFTGPLSRFVEREPRRFNFSAAIWDAVEPLEALVPANVRLVHDAEDLYIRFADGRVLEGDVRLVIHVWPFEQTGPWRITVRADKSVVCETPASHPVAPHCRTRFESDARGPRTLVSIPFCEFVRPGEVGGTALSGDTWRIAIQRLEGAAADAPSPQSFVFAGGPTRRRIELPGWEEPFFGVNVIRFQSERQTSKGVNATLTPAPAEYLRAKDPAHIKFRVAKAGTYRIRVRLPQEPPEESEESDEMLPGEASCAGGTVFVLPDIWKDLEAMEQDIDRFQAAAREKGVALEESVAENLEFFESMVLQADGYRMPRVKERMEPGFFDLVKSMYAEAWTSLSEALPDVAAAHPMSVEAAGFNLDALIATPDSEDANPPPA